MSLPGFGGLHKNHQNKIEEIQQKKTGTPLRSGKPV
jgi:hypothetical protein